MGALLALVERIRLLHEERGIAFGIGGFAGDRASASYRFWTLYARAFPQGSISFSARATGSRYWRLTR
jgi:hypothetical protein